MKKTIQWLWKTISLSIFTPAPKTVTAVNRRMSKHPPYPNTISTHHNRGGHPQRPIF